MISRNRKFFNFVTAILIIGMCFGSGITTIISNVDFYGESETVTIEPVAEEHAKELTDRLQPDKLEVKHVTYSPFKAVECTLPEELQQYTYYICQFYKIDFYLALALMKVESEFKTDAVSETDDYGLMQINACNHKSLKEALGITDIMDEKQNIHAGLYMLNNLLKKYKAPTLALMAYKLGEHGAEEQWNNGVFETQYTKDVLSAAYTYSASQ